MYEPIGWTFSASCVKLDDKIYGEFPEKDKIKLENFLDRFGNTFITAELVKTHGWYDKSYLSTISHA